MHRLKSAYGESNQYVANRQQTDLAIVRHSPLNNLLNLNELIAYFSNQKRRCRAVAAPWRGICNTLHLPARRQ
jgi:hypothetical protein